MRGRRTKITDVAEAVGVSAATVSLALNDKGRLDPATRERVKRAAAELGYRPSVPARRLRGGRTGTVALLTAVPEAIVASDSNLGFLVEMAMPVARTLLEHGHSLLLVPPLSRPEDLHALDVDGAIVIDPVPADPLCALLRRHGIAVVTVGRAAGTPADGVVERGDAGAAVILAHLAEQGARRVGVVVSAEGHSGSAGVRGWAEGAAPVPVTVATAEAATGERGAYAVARELLESGEVDAVYAPFDAFALAAVRAAHDLGLDVPRDVMVATNYDGRRAAASDPPLTALDLDLPGMGRVAARLLVERLATSAGDDEAPETTAAAPEPRLLARRSTARA